MTAGAVCGHLGCSFAPAPLSDWTQGSRGGPPRRADRRDEQVEYGASAVVATDGTLPLVAGRNCRPAGPPVGDPGGTVDGCRLVPDQVVGCPGRHGDVADVGGCFAVVHDR